LPETLVSRVEFEITQIDRLLESYAELLDRVCQTEPDLVELTATASVLHSFYTAVENVLLAVARQIDGQVPEGARSHRDLLVQMADSTIERPAVLSEKIAHRLGQYMAFRHFYRHAYSFYLEWDEMADLVSYLDDVWSQTKLELEQFLNKMRSQGVT
jgi:hypothetical protein